MSEDVIELVALSDSILRTLTDTLKNLTQTELTSLQNATTN